MQHAKERDTLGGALRRRAARTLDVKAWARISVLSTLPALIFLPLGSAAAQDRGRIQDPPLASSSDGLLQAHKFIGEGNYGEALRILSQVKSQSSGMKGLAHDLGVVYYHLSDLKNAVIFLQQAVVEASDDHEAEQLLGMSFFQLGKPADAIVWLTRLKSALPPGNVDVNYALALCYIRTRDYESARGSFAEMYGVAPDSAAGYLVTARMLLRQGDDRAAEVYGQKAAAMDANLPFVHLLLGEIYLYRTDLQRSVQEFAEELRLSPACAAAYDRLADAKMRLGQPGEAEVLLKRSILLDSTSTGPYILLGKVQLKKKDYLQATMYLERAVQMDGRNFMAHHLLGEAYRGIGKFQEAQRELEMAEQLQSAQDTKARDASTAN